MKNLSNKVIIISGFSKGIGVQQEDSDMIKLIGSNK
jgi:hypothetical protein